MLTAKNKENGFVVDFAHTLSNVEHPIRPALFLHQSIETNLSNFSMATWSTLMSSSNLNFASCVTSSIKAHQMFSFS